MPSEADQQIIMTQQQQPEQMNSGGDAPSEKLPSVASSVISDEEYSSSLSQSLAQVETRVVNTLRAIVIIVLLIIAVLAASSVYLYTRGEERERFASQFGDDALLVIKSFHESVERNIQAASSLSTDVTSFALYNNLTFPFVTLPDFELRGSHFRALSGSNVVQWAPLVTKETRAAWEKYALENRFQIDKAFEVNARFIRKQDEAFNVTYDGPQERRHLDHSDGNQTSSVETMSILEDGTGYHLRIYSTGVVTDYRGDEPEDAGPFLPLWQSSPVGRPKQATLNLNYAHTRAVSPDLVELITRDQKPIIGQPFIPPPAWRPFLQGLLRESQYREHIGDCIDDLYSFITHPVFDSFENNRKTVGVLATMVDWEFLFSNRLPDDTEGIICVVEISHHRPFSYRIDDHNATPLGWGDFHDPKYDSWEVSAEVADFLQSRANVQHMAYLTQTLSDVPQYTIRVYPSHATEDRFLTSTPIIYTCIVVAAFVLFSTLFLTKSYVVEKRQKIMMERVLDNAKRAAAAERELNEFLSHEVRNPLSAAMLACSFVATAVNEPNPLSDTETRRFVREDIEVVDSSLHFINDFLRSMLEIHRAGTKRIKFRSSPVDILRDILEPVSTIQYKRSANFEIQVDCPHHLMVMGDSLRLKQIVLNLVRNSSKFVERGFVRMRADVVRDNVRLYVEDSGPGVTPEKRRELFGKYQTSLDVLNQGTGIGLSLSKKLMTDMGGEIWLDEEYVSGIDGCPGARFVMELKFPPLDVECALPKEKIRNYGGTGHCEEVFNSETGSEETSKTTSFDTNALGAGRREQNDASAATMETVSDTQKPQEKPRSVKITPMMELPTELSVLFVDDDAILRKLFARAVKKILPNWKIQEASNGETAVRLCETETFDLIFLDQYMASINKQLLGTETAHIMRSKGIKSKICGLSSNDLKDVFVKAGADDFMLKPIPCKPDDLRQALQHILSHRQKRTMVACING